MTLTQAKTETLEFTPPPLPDPDSLAPLDVEQFWRDQEESIANPFGKDIPQLPLGIRMGKECIFDELGIPEDWYRLMHDEPYRIAISKAYNDRAEAIVGRRLLSEKPSDPERRYPPHKQLHDIFEGRNVWHNESYWLQPSASSEKELEALLDRVEERLESLRDFILPENWDEEKARLSALGIAPPRYRGQRGPVTFATSIYGAENLLFLIIDNPSLAARFRDCITRSILGIAEVLDEEGSFTPETAPRGWYWCDDNCCLLNPEMYDFFARPIHEAVYARYAPDPEDSRGQHSDSNMEHLLPILGEFDLKSVNFGPTLTIETIRRHLPNAVIRGQLAPFTFSRNEEEKMVAELKRDFEQARDARGVVFTTAGSINNGSQLTGMRLLMSTIQNECRF